MACSQPISDYSDSENDTSESKSNVSLSTGYFPCEDDCYSESTACTDTSSVGSSVHLLPPIQGTWQTESTRRRMLRRDQVPDNPEQFCKLSIATAWDMDVDSDPEDTTDWVLSGEQQWTDQCPVESTKRTLSKLGNLMQKLETLLENRKDDEDKDSVFPAATEEEDSQGSSTSPHLARVSPQEHNSSQDWARLKGSEAKDATRSPENSLRLSEDELAQQRAAQVTCSRRTSISLEQPETEGTPRGAHTFFCLHFGRIFHWLRQQLFSPLLRRDRPAKVAGSPQQKAPRKSLCCRSKRIQPQDFLEEGSCASLNVLSAPVVQAP
ncbi:uncharacterized protein C12orf71 homolog [Ochotona curzoniae]|uniref:uncharacterized protein C12orf71 homolog n=1 Tax=Ochotona curzoniae TaxID=130825 RepID=UPI001B35075F|nr:uncharacterized protein C12orf71 homolog [Ochotona curzoniae]